MQRHTLVPFPLCTPPRRRIPATGRAGGRRHHERPLEQSRRQPAPRCLVPLQARAASFISCRRSPAPPAPSSARRPAMPPTLFVAAYRSSKRLTSSFRWPQPRATRHTGEELPAAVLEPIQPQPPKIPATPEARRSCASIVPLFQRSCYRPRHCSLPAKNVSVDLRQVPLPPSSAPYVYDYTG